MEVENANQIWLYLSDVKDGRSTEDRLRRAVYQCCETKHHIKIVGSEEQIKIARTDRGKPYLADYPQIHVSVSHSGAWCVCAVAETPVGVDIQEHVRMEGESIEEASQRFRQMAHRFFHPIEAAFVDEESYYRFFGVWAARESYVKYTGKGIDASFSEFCVIPEKKDRQPELGEMSKANIWQAEGVSFWETRYQNDYTLCVCAKTSNLFIDKMEMI